MKSFLCLFRDFLESEAKTDKFEIFVFPLICVYFTVHVIIYLTKMRPNRSCGASNITRAMSNCNYSGHCRT